MLSVPKGFSFASARAGFKYQGREDLGLILSHSPAQGAGVFTRNRFQAAPVQIARQRLSSNAHQIRAIVVNSGQANACTGERGHGDCLQSLRLTGKCLGIDPESILPASTGVIGQSLDLDRWQACQQDLLSSLKHAGPLQVSRAILTTDSYPKTAWRKVQTSNGEFNVLGMAKGAGMICPDMATMLAFVITDANVQAGAWQEMLQQATDQSFNRISVDGDTSTNDCVLALANGASQVEAGSGKVKDWLAQALQEVCQDLAYLIVQDAEGGSKVVRINLKGALNGQQAESAARSIAHSPLVKCAFFGQDPNWGRIVAALGRSKAEFVPSQIRVSIQGRQVFQEGCQTEEDLDALLAQCMHRQEIQVDVDLAAGSAEYQLLTSDLSLEYVRINSAYRS
ncbi:MAG: bifunctional glutamate N-acetyltransferase/amino-acid acetyltransferase ArgJ [Thermodesulfobacteriota bacterium]